MPSMLNLPGSTRASLYTFLGRFSPCHPWGCILGGVFKEAGECNAFRARHFTCLNYASQTTHNWVIYSTLKQHFASSLKKTTNNKIVHPWNWNKPNFRTFLISYLEMDPRNIIIHETKSTVKMLTYRNFGGGGWGAKFGYFQGPVLVTKLKPHKNVNPMYVPCPSARYLGHKIRKYTIYRI